MNHIKKLRFLAFGILIIMFSCTGNQQKKIAELRFCDNLNSFIENLDDLAIANESDDVDAFYRVYDRTVRSWDRLENSAADLENLEIDQATKAYNKMDYQISKIESDSKTSDDAGQIAAQINSTSDEINNILTTVCN
jgi:hypothetical protein